MTKINIGDKVLVLSGSPDKYDGKTGTVKSIGDMGHDTYTVIFSDSPKDYLILTRCELLKINETKEEKIMGQTKFKVGDVIENINNGCGAFRMGVVTNVPKEHKDYDWATKPDIVWAYWDGSKHAMWAYVNQVQLVIPEVKATPVTKSVKKDAEVVFEKGDLVEVVAECHGGPAIGTRLRVTKSELIAYGSLQVEGYEGGNSYLTSRFKLVEKANKQSPVGVKYKHIRPDYANAKTGGITISYRLVTGKNGGRELHYGIAYCNKNDQFNKAIGREVALKQMLDKPNVLQYDPLVANLFPGYNKVRPMDVINWMFCATDDLKSFFIALK